VKEFSKSQGLALSANTDSSDQGPTMSLFVVVVSDVFPAIGPGAPQTLVSEWCME